MRDIRSLPHYRFLIQKLFWRALVLSSVNADLFNASLVNAVSKERAFLEIWLPRSANQHYSEHR
jgi:hypothetical protein